jgi:hypothetical protein
VPPLRPSSLDSCHVAHVGLFKSDPSQNLQTSSSAKSVVQMGLD